VWVVVGLGNPGTRYAATRHNLGYAVVDALAGNAAADWRSERDCLWAVLSGDFGDAALVKPTTYMNDSGRAAREALSRFGASPENLLVVVDDLHLILGRIRIRREGSDGGHNGLASIIGELGTEAFPRLRMGIGPQPEGDGRIDFVLDVFAPEEREPVAGMVVRAAEAVRAVWCDGVEKAMNRYNGS
jgi:PTH1 family peptidyl-tRNA hydrolase